MAKTFGVSIGGEEELKRNIDYLAKNFPDWLAEGNMDTAEKIIDQAHQNILDIDAYDTRELYRSLTIRTARNGLSVAVGSTAKHAPYIEYGTRPHFPPVSKIRAWCIRKNIPPGAAFAIARKIAERGTPPRPWLNPAYQAAKRDHMQRMKNFVWQGMRSNLKQALGR